MTWNASPDAIAPDAQRAVIDFLAGLGLEVDGEPVNVEDMYPETATPEAPALPALTVVDDGADEWTSLYERSLVQVTAWATNPSPARDLSARARAHLLASRSLGSVTPATRSAPVQDAETGYWLCAFTVRVLAANT